MYDNGLAIAGLVCTLLYILSQWREIARPFSGRQARSARSRPPACSSSFGHPGRDQLPGNRHNKRWDLTAAKQFSLSDQTKKVLHELKKPVKVRSSRAATSSRASAIGSTNTRPNRSS